MLEAVLRTDIRVTPKERQALQAALLGGTVDPAVLSLPLLVSQKRAAELLEVSRVTIWRMTKDSLLHPIEVLPGTFRYRYEELAVIARGDAAQRQEEL